MLSEIQVERYSRQIILPQVGGRGQEALLCATVTICGSNELATTAALYLAAAGVGHLRVSPPTAAVIEGMNPDCDIALVATDDGNSATSDATCGAAVVGCAGASAATCAQMNASCIAARVPFIFGDATDTQGWMSICAGFEPDAPCYGCLVRQLGRAFCGATPLGAVTAGFIGTLLATEAVKIVLGLQTSYVGRLIMFDALAGEVRETSVVKDPCCAVCGGRA